MKREEFNQKLINTLRVDLPNASLSKITEMIERAQEYFLWFTNRKVVPTSAFYLILDMSKALEQLDVFDKDNSVKSVKAGDTTVEFESGKDSYEILKRFSKSLNSYKKVKML